MNDYQALQDAVNRELVPVEKFQRGATFRAEAARKGGKSFGKGKYKWDDRWGGDRHWSDRRPGPYNSGKNSHYQASQYYQEDRHRQNGNRWSNQSVRNQGLEQVSRE